MKKISYSHKVELFSSNQLERYFKNMRIGIFDIETLGLKPVNCPMILAGFMTVDSENNCTITQYFAETPEEEPKILESLKEEFKTVDYILTYNGKHFDMPFVAKRAELLNIDGIENSLYNLDLYLILNGHSEVKRLLKNLKQKTVEEYMGLSSSRDDAISGADSILLYEKYVQCTDMAQKTKLEEDILLHNHDDLLQLAQLMPILRQVQFQKALFSLGFPILGQSGWPTFNIGSIKIKADGLFVKGSYYGEGFSYMSYETPSSPYSCRFDEDKKFSFSIRVDRHKGNTFLNLPIFFSDYMEFKKYPNYMQNFLLINSSDGTNHLEVNMFLKAFFNKFMEDNICPLMTL